MGKLAIIAVVCVVVAVTASGLLNAEVGIIVLGVFVYANVYLVQANDGYPLERRRFHQSLALWSNSGVLVIAALKFFELVSAAQQPGAGR